MKTLIAAASVAVIAFVGYFFWGEYTSARAVAAASAQTEALRKELFTLAGADDGEEGLVKGWCELTSARLHDRLANNAQAKRIVQNCRALNYL